MAKRHHEQHRIENIGWLRASVLGANDGIVSTACLLVGVAAAHADHRTILLTGVAGLVAGAMSMATGEYVSVHSQSDSEKAALAEESAELAADYPAEHRELTSIYMHRGLDLALAGKVATELMAHDALGAHARDELGISHISTARPLQAAVASAASFSAGALVPLIVASLAPADYLISSIEVAALLSLALLGWLAAKAGGARVLPAVARVTFWSALAMAVTSGAGYLFGT
ncbi:VIT family protein [Oxalobacteraceae bacterium CAVE-383]|nr:VIT family protein [Oxalobacteraceae bacterium CAVE-383]